MQELNESNFEAEVLKSDKPVAVDFWAAWCSPCKMLSPIFEKVSGELTDVKFAKVNVDENQGLAQQLGVMSLPTIVIFKNGEEAERIVGYVDEAKLKSNISGAL